MAPLSELRCAECLASAYMVPQSEDVPGPVTDDHHGAQQPVPGASGGHGLYLKSLACATLDRWGMTVEQQLLSRLSIDWRQFGDSDGSDSESESIITTCNTTQFLYDSIQVTVQSRFKSDSTRESRCPQPTS